MRGDHQVLHLILPRRHLANDRLSGPLGGLREAIPLSTALHASDVTTTLWTLITTLWTGYQENTNIINLTTHAFCCSLPINNCSGHTIKSTQTQIRYQQPS